MRSRERQREVEQAWVTTILVAACVVAAVCVGVWLLHTLPMV
jgi:hypothetical protein